MEERNLKFYGIIGCIAYLTRDGRKQILLESFSVSQFLQLNKIAKRYQKEALKHNMNKLEEEFKHLCYKISCGYGFLLYPDFNKEDKTIKLELKQDGYSFDISEVLYL